MATKKHAAVISEIEQFVWKNILPTGEEDYDCEDEKFTNPDLSKLLSKPVFDTPRSWQLSTEMNNFYSNDAFEDVTGFDNFKEINDHIDSEYAKIIKKTQAFIKKKHAEIHVDKSEEDSDKPKTIKSRAISGVAKAGKTVLVRKVSRKLVSGAQTQITSLLENNPKFQAFLPYLNTDIGRVLLTGVLAVGLEFIPLPEALKDKFEPIKSLVAAELGAMALDEGTVPIEKLVAVMLPALQASLMPLLSAPELKKLTA